MDDPQGFLFCNLSGEEAASGIGCGFLPFAKVRIGEIDTRINSKRLDGLMQARIALAESVECVSERNNG